MPLPAPNLDDRTFQQLVDEARLRIPRYTPEWTNFNDSDPGIALVKLHAWLTETILFRLNQLPDLTYTKFLDLLNVQPTPAVAAGAELTFKLKKLSGVNDPLVVLVPKSTQTGVDDPDLEQELIFETDRTLVAVNAALAAVIVPETGGTRNLVTEYDAAAGETAFSHTFLPFGPASTAGAQCLFGFIVRPFRQNGVDYSLDRFPAGELDFTAFVPEVFEKDATGTRIEGPMSMECLFPAQVQAAAQDIVWEAYYGIQHGTDFPGSTDPEVWRRLNVQDGTAGLRSSGHIYLDVPGGMPAVPFGHLSRAFWASLSLTKPPAASGELADDIANGLLAPEELQDQVWIDLGITGANLTTLQTLLGDPVANRAAIATLLRGLTLNFGRVETAVWLNASDAYDAPPFPYELSWFRARLTAAREEAPQVVRLLHNTVGATAAVTRFEEVLGTSNGLANQTFRLSRTPVVVDMSQQPPVPDLTIEVRPDTDDVPCVAVTDFFGQDADSSVYVLDASTGTITFGDGLHGRIPLAGGRIVAARYRYGGGAAGNAGPGTITALKSSVPNVDSVTNFRAAAGGADAESLDEAKLRAPHDLRHRERAVTAEDFADLARQTPGVRIQRAFALPLTRAERMEGSSPPQFELVKDVPGAVTVVALPENKEETPQPTEDQLRLVCEHLNGRRLITTELYVTGPRYVLVTELAVEVFVRRQADLKAVHDALTSRLLEYFHPLRGGEDGRGWPFGQDIFFGHVYRQVLAVADVTRAQCLAIRPAAGGEACDDYISIPDGALVHMPGSALNLQVSYDSVG
jgi:baseplate J-like protein